MDLVNAQQARRILDRLVGYGISPILWEKVRSRLSAGRVQSVALRLIVEREREIEAFVPVEYWTIEAELKPEGGKMSYVAHLFRVNDKEPELINEDVVKAALADLRKAKYQIQKIKRSERRRKPSAPFITSTLQQEASRKLGILPAHHGPGPAALRRLGRGGWRYFRPDYLYAYQLDQRFRPGRQRSAQLYRRQLRQ